MKLLICLTLALSLFASLPQSDIKLEIGAKLNRKYIPRKITEEILTNPSQTRPFIKRIIDGVEYIIAFNQRTREIRYVHTSDKDFRTKNGLQVGSEISVAKNQMVSYPGWEIRAPITPDGWYPVVGYDLPKLGALPDNAAQKSETLTLTIVGFSKGGN